MAGGAPPPWRPYYAKLWMDAREVAAYVEAEYTQLRKRTVSFKEALFASTLPPRTRLPWAAARIPLPAASS